jgi:predicted DCC family thiol-disulfide oxidoreductase YuxK
MDIIARRACQVRWRAFAAPMDGGQIARLASEMTKAAYSYRDDPDVPAFADDRAIIIFDGKCVMCSWFAQIVLRNDRRLRFRLLAAQSPLGAALYRHYGLDPVEYETNILIEEGVATFKSAASLRILEQLSFPWSMAAIGWLLPRMMRDWLYDVVARNRLRWFGVRETCYAPQPADADRFLSS